MLEKALIVDNPIYSSPRRRRQAFWTALTVLGIASLAMLDVVLGAVCCELGKLF